MFSLSEPPAAVECRAGMARIGVARLGSNAVAPSPRGPDGASENETDRRVGGQHEAVGRALRLSWEIELRSLANL